MTQGEELRVIPQQRVFGMESMNRHARPVSAEGPGGSPFWGAGRVAGGDAGLHAVRALQAQSVVCRIATGWRLVMQDGVMHCWRQI